MTDKYVVVYEQTYSVFENEINKKAKEGYVILPSSYKINPIPSEGTFHYVIMEFPDKSDIAIWLQEPLDKLKEVIDNFSGGYFDLHKITYEDLMKILQNIMELATK